MARNLTAGLLAEILKQRLNPVFFVELQTAAGFVRVWSGAGTISWNGQSWTGVGKFGAVSAMGETAEVQAEGVKLLLSGIPSDMVTTAFTDLRQGLPVKIYFGAVDDSGAVIADPYLSFSGRVDACDFVEAGQTATLQISCESRLIDLKRARARRYTHEDQQIDFPGDLGFEYVAQLQELNLSWGRGDPIPTLPSGSVGGGGPDSPDYDQRIE